MTADAEAEGHAPTYAQATSVVALAVGVNAATTNLRVVPLAGAIGAAMGAVTAVFCVFRLVTLRAWSFGFLHDDYGVHALRSPYVAISAMVTLALLAISMSMIGGGVTVSRGGSARRWLVVGVVAALTVGVVGAVMLLLPSMAIIGTIN